MHSPSALTEHVSQNLARVFFLDPVLFKLADHLIDIIGGCIKSLLEMGMEPHFIFIVAQFRVILHHVLLLKFMVEHQQASTIK